MVLPSWFGQMSLLLSLAPDRMPDIAVSVCLMGSGHYLTHDYLGYNNIMVIILFDFVSL